MPVGGIGTGNIFIGRNGQWRDEEIMNKPAMGLYVAYTIGRICRFGRQPPPQSVCPGLQPPALMQPILLGTVNLEDSAMPVSAKAKVFNRFIPGITLPIVTLWFCWQAWQQRKNNDVIQ